MPHNQEIAPSLGRLVDASRRGLALFGSVLAMGGAGLADAQLSFANTAHQPEPVYGLSGLKLTDTDLNITAQPGWNLIAGPRSPYHTKWIRALIHPADLKSSNNTIKAYLKYAQNFLDYMPGQGVEAPVVVSLSTTNADVTSVNHGVDVCDRYVPDTSKVNQSYNSTACADKTQWIVAKNTPILMRKFPIKYWTAQNEPENKGLPTNSSTGGEKLAVKLYLGAAKTARDLKKHQVIIAGEFGNSPSAYEKGYERDISIDTKKNGLPEPAAWAFHPYRDTVCNRLTDTTGDINDLVRFGLYKPAKKKRVSVWITEAGVQLETTNDCSNATGLANQKKQNPATLTPSQLETMAQNQVNSARTFRNLYKADRSIQFHIFYYDPSPGSPWCWRGGYWDTGMWAPNGSNTKGGYGTPKGEGIPGSERPVLFTLTGRALPPDLKHPKTLPAIRRAVLDLVPPGNFTPLRAEASPLTPLVSSRPNCNYGSQLPH